MANDNRKPPHKHDPELARKEALKARQTRTHHSSQKGDDILLPIGIAAQEGRYPLDTDEDNDNGNCTGRQQCRQKEDCLHPLILFQFFSVFLCTDAISYITFHSSPILIIIRQPGFPGCLASHVF